MDAATPSGPDNIGKGGYPTDTGAKPSGDGRVILAIKGASKTFENASQKITALQTIDLEVR